MGFRYCPNCKEMIEAKALLSGYSQVDFNGAIAKRRKVIHREEDGGCGQEWWTLEIAEEFLEISTSDNNDPNNCMDAKS